MTDEQFGSDTDLDDGGPSPETEALIAQSRELQAGEPVSDGGRNLDPRDDPTPGEIRAAQREMEETRGNPDFYDPKFKRLHPAQHQAWLDRIAELTEKSTTARDRMTPLERAKIDGLAAVEQRQEVLCSQAEVAMAALVSMGFPESAVPHDITDCETGGLVAHQCLALGNYDNFEMLARKGLALLPMRLRAESERLFDEYREAEPDERELKGEAFLFEIVATLQEFHKLPRNCLGRKAK